MNRFMVMAVAAGMLAAGAAARAAEKEAPIDWPARAATVKVGMTHAEVFKILPPRIETTGYEKGKQAVGYALSSDLTSELYWVSEYWQVHLSFRRGEKEQRLYWMRMQKWKSSTEPQIDWPARAALVKVGMTRAEVEKILPVWAVECGGEDSSAGNKLVKLLRAWFAKESYFVSKDCVVRISYDGAGGAQNRVKALPVIEKLKTPLE